MKLILCVQDDLKVAISMPIFFELTIKQLLRREIEGYYFDYLIIFIGNKLFSGQWLFNRPFWQCVDKADYERNQERCFATRR